MEVSKNLKKINFRTFFSDSEVKKITFWESEAQIEISKKIEKNRKSARRGRVSCGNHPKPVFWSLGGPCDQNESYTSLIRPFLTKFCGPEVGAFMADFPEIAFWSICECEIPPSKNLGFWRNNFFANFFSGKCFLCSWLLEKKVSAYENHFWSFYNTLKCDSSFLSIFL